MSVRQCSLDNTFDRETEKIPCAYLCLTNTLEQWLQKAYNLLSLQFSLNLDYLSSFIFLFLHLFFVISRSHPQPNTLYM